MTNLYIETNLKELGIDPDSIQNVFITHTHVDHIAGLKVFLKKHHPTVYVTEAMFKELSELMVLPNYVILKPEFDIDDLHVEVFKTSHDTDSVGYIFTSQKKSFVYVTDTGYIHVKYHEQLKNKDIYVFESNHDIGMLMDNPHYPYPIKVRIRGDEGHLSNYQSSEYLTKFVGNNTKYIVLAHLSEQNNTHALALSTLQEKLVKKEIQIDHILTANQNEKTELLEV